MAPSSAVLPLMTAWGFLEVGVDRWDKAAVVFLGKAVKIQLQGVLCRKK